MSTVGVTGMRPESTGRDEFDPSDPLWVDAYHFVLRNIDGFESLVSGGARGFDMVAAKVAVDESLPLVLALPFQGFDKSWGERDRRRLQWLINQADEVVYVGHGATARDKYLSRNDYIVDRSDHILALWDGKSGGTGYTLSKARKAGVGSHTHNPVKLL